MKKRSPACLCLLLSSSLLLFAQPSSAQAKSPHTVLREGWTLQSSAKINEAGEQISTPKYLPQDWYTVSVPTTVFAALVKAKVYPDPLFGMNLRSLPGVTYPIGGNFSNFPMQPDSPFAVPWWYRKEFTLPAAYQGKTVWLKFYGINYRANIWLNGRLIANQEQVAGAWRTFEFDITKAALPGKANVLAVE